MNQSYARVNAPYATLNVFGVQLYENNALLLCTLSILDSDWLQHVRTIPGVYEFITTHGSSYCLTLQIMHMSASVFQEYLMYDSKNSQLISGT